MKKLTNRQRYGINYDREANRRHEIKRKQETPVYAELARKLWRIR